MWARRAGRANHLEAVGLLGTTGTCMIRQSPILSLPENIEAPLWRYMSFDKLASLLKESALYFRRADLFEDPLEGRHSTPTLNHRPVMFAGATDSWLTKTMPTIDARTRKCVFVICWHNSDAESSIMWAKYARENKGRAIKSSLGRIRNAILDRDREFLVNPVRYIDYSKDHTSDANSFYAFFCKDRSYAEEREVRFAFIEHFELVGNDDFDSLALEEGIFIPVDIHLLVDKIILGPSTNDEDARRVRALLLASRLDDRSQHSEC